MLPELGHEEVVLIGYSRTLLAALADELRPGSVLVVEEPTVAASRNVVALAGRNRVVSRVLLWEYQDLSSIGALVESDPAVRGARAVVPGIEYAVEPAACLASLLGCPGAGPDAAAVFRDKVRQRHVAATAGLRNPAFAVVRSVAEALAFFDRARTRCVLKPTARQASLGVRFAGTGDEVAAGFRHAREADEPTLVPARGIRSEVIIEGALEGTEYSVEMLVANGHAVFSNLTAKRVLSGDYPVELGHVLPGAPTAGLRRQLVEGTARLATAAGFGSGVLHCEWIVDRCGPALVECAARMPGDDIATLLSLAYDTSFVQAYLAVLLGAPVELPPYPPYGAAVTFLTAPPGTVRRVTGAELAAASPCVRSVKVTAAVGDVVHPVCSSWDRVGYVITRARTASEAQASALRAAQVIRVETEQAR